MTLTIYGDRISGNCLKVKWVADRLGLPYHWIDVDVVKGESRKPAYLAQHPGGQVPAIILADGRPLAQSNAIMLHLADGSDLIPADAYARALMFQWLFWEQYSHEPVIAVRRFQKLYLGKSEAEIGPELLVKGAAVLALMERTLTTQTWFAGAVLSLADIALVAYTRVAHEGGFDLRPYPAVTVWVARVEAAVPIQD